MRSTSDEPTNRGGRTVAGDAAPAPGTAPPPAPGTRDLKTAVRSFWEADPCGSKQATAPAGSPEFFAQVDARRDRLEPFIAAFADFEGAQGQDVLEIGVGLGSDFVRFARAGARATGVDLTESAIDLVRRRFGQEGLDCELRVADAEALPFADASFDRVYSWGVLHHTPDTERAVREALRVLRPGGEACVMLYARRSWVAFGLWLRYAALRGRLRRPLADVVAHHMESEGTKSYSVAELRAMFAPLEQLTVQHVATPYDRRVAGPLARITGRWLGWFLVIKGRLPAGSRTS
jgi:ubiquinone/menaquinone biosynthesis C-methylase UbiE